MLSSDSVHIFIMLRTKLKNPILNIYSMFFVAFPNPNLKGGKTVKITRDSVFLVLPFSVLPLKKIRL